ncbi:MAG: hypothetical protein SF187_21540 [Deltaproteobacteria bacterium]|nr:hypothetical protein [Deltaproteobacteria bacterium]
MKFQSLLLTFACYCTVACGVQPKGEVQGPDDGQGGDLGQGGEAVVDPPLDSPLGGMSADARESGSRDAATPEIKPDGSNPTSSNQDAQPVALQGDGVFVAVGHGGRRLSSCDDGATWSHEVKVNDSDADHATWSGMGLAYGHGVFVALYGWGVPTASLFRSEDGVAWQQTFGVSQTGSTATSITFGDGAFLAVADRSKAHISNDLGMNWKTVQWGGDAPVLRRLVYAKGKFIAFGDNGRVVVSSDRGATWKNLSLPQGCLGRFDTAVAAGNDFILGVGRGGGCRSDDGGTTWIPVTAPNIPGTMIWTGHDFYATGLRESYRSPDGATWVTQKHSLEQNTWVSSVAVSDKGTFVGVDENGDRFFRSVDGRVWKRVVASTGTIITALAFGRLQTGKVCK